MTATTERVRLDILLAKLSRNEDLLANKFIKGIGKCFYNTLTCDKVESTSEDIIMGPELTAAQFRFPIN